MLIHRVHEQPIELAKVIFAQKKKGQKMQKYRNKYV